MGEGSGRKSPLDSDHGTTVDEESVVTGIVSVVVWEAEKVRPSTGGTRVPDDSSPMVGEFIGNLGGTNRARRVTVQVDGREASVDLPLNIPYGEPIPEITQTA